MRAWLRAGLLALRRLIKQYKRVSALVIKIDNRKSTRRDIVYANQQRVAALRASVLSVPV